MYFHSAFQNSVTVDPVLIAYGVRPSKSKTRHWQRIGAAWPHEQGSGLAVALDVVPRDGDLVLLERNADDNRRLQAKAERMAKAWPKDGA